MFLAIDGTLIIGAGPFGLSVSAHLSDLGVDHRVVGRTMDTWRAHMPVGMCLKSEPYASAIASPSPGYDLARYCQSHGLDYGPRQGPVALERFLGYGDWYAEQLVPDVGDVTVSEVAAAPGGFRVTFADAEPMTAGQIVVATGVLPHATIPAELSDLPSDLVTHSSDHHELGRFRGRRVAVIGAGQSALETAALLHEAGADTRLIARCAAISWLGANPAQLGRIGHIRRPVTNLCEGWRCAVWNSPGIFRRLPTEMRVTKARTVLGPAGAWWLKERVEGVVDALTAHRLTGALPHGSGVRLVVDGPQQSTIDVDHVIAGTGFRIDVGRLPFLPEELRARIGQLDGYPVLSRSCESTVPGLYFAGAPAAVSLGPSMRFVAGTHNTARLIARSLARRSSRASRGRVATLPASVPSPHAPAAERA